MIPCLQYDLLFKLDYVRITDTEPSFEFFILFYFLPQDPPLKSIILQILSVGTSNDVPRKLHVYYISHII